jgi:4-oxalocrotonate tautomerase
MMPEVVVYAVEGRSVEQKRALFKAITDAVVTHFGTPASAVTVSLVETPKMNKAKGGVPFTDLQPAQPAKPDKSAAG